MSFSVFSFAAVLVTLASAVGVGDDARLLRREMQTLDNGQHTAHHKHVRKIEREAEWAERLERHASSGYHSQLTLWKKYYCRYGFPPISSCLFPVICFAFTSISIIDFLIITFHIR